MRVTPAVARRLDVHRQRIVAGAEAREIDVGVDVVGARRG